MRRTNEDAKATRDRILGAALNVFSRDGYASTRLEDIALEAGVTRGAVYHHFGGKPEVYMALINEKFKGVNSHFQQLASDVSAPRETLKRLAVELLLYLEEDADYRKMQELVLFKTTRKPELEEGMQYKISGTKAFIEQLTAVLHKGQDLGVFRKELDTEAAALALLALLNGIAALWLMDNSLFSIRAKAEEMVEIYLKGLS